MKTPYGELNNGDVYTSADCSGHKVKVVDVDKYADVQDVVVERADGFQYRLDWFKLMMVRYRKMRDECCHRTMLLGTRCNGCPLAKPDDKLLPARD